MRTFVFYSKTAKTTGKFDNPMQAGRLDIVFNVVIQALSLSNKIRDDVHLHLIFDGPPNSPLHLEFDSSKKIPLSKKDVGGLIKRMLYKWNDKKKTEVFEGCYIERKSLSELLKELAVDKKICIMDIKGKSIRDIKNLDDCVFLIGDHEGLPKKELKRYKDKFSVGPEVYFASQVFVLVNNELDLRN
jgi:tRNA (pseudouridine54-N1)-methyltransferase